MPTAFDPATATAAYLARLSPDELQRAIDYTRGAQWNLLWGWLVGLAVAWLVLRTGLLARISTRMGRGRPRPFRTAFLCALAFGVLGFILSLPWAAYSRWWFEKRFDLTSQPLTGWLTDTVIVEPILLLLNALFLAAVYLLLRKAKRTWWLWGGAVGAIFILFAFVLAPITVEPLLNRYTPAPPGPVRDEVVRLGELTGTPTDKIFVYDGSKQSNRYTANVAGLGPTARVALSDTMFKKNADLAEVRGVVGHEMGHYKRQHSLWFVAVFSVLIALGLALTGLVFPLFARLLGAPSSDMTDPANLPALSAAIATLALLATPLINTTTRFTEADADAYSLRYAREPDGLSSALIKTAEYRAPSPSRLEEFLFYSHPSVENRIRRAMDWKARNAGTPSPERSAEAP